jgi:6-phosphogluconolactonase
MGIKVIVKETTEQLSESLGQFVNKIGQDKVNKKGSFTVALSGGSLPTVLGKGLISAHQKEGSSSSHFSSWQAFLADERHVPLDDPQSNFTLCKTNLFDKLPFNHDNTHPVDTHLSLNEAAVNYEKKIQQIVGQEGQFDMIFLGIGPDGHTCSLFPNHPLITQHEKTDKLVLWLDDSPKPPPQRVTLTAPVLLKADYCVYVITGKEKAQAIKEIFEDDQVTHVQRPSKIVNSSQHNVVWFLDSAAASLLTNTAFVNEA